MKEIRGAAGGALGVAFVAWLGVPVTEITVAAFAFSYVAAWIFIVTESPE